MKDILNARIKHREPFRPFAPVDPRASRPASGSSRTTRRRSWCWSTRRAPRSAQLIPAVNHVDGTGRLQTVEREANPRYYRLIEEFERLTGVPILLNTSFNENEPIVMTPAQAIDTFLRRRGWTCSCSGTRWSRDAQAEAPMMRRSRRRSAGR